MGQTEVKMAKMTFKVKINDLHFQYQLRVSQDACLVQIWGFQLKSVTSYHVDKQKFTDGRTDRRTDAGNDNTPSAWKANGGKWYASFELYHQSSESVNPVSLGSPWNVGRD